MNSLGLGSITVNFCRKSKKQVGNPLNNISKSRKAFQKIKP